MSGKILSDREVREALSCINDPESESALIEDRAALRELVRDLADKKGGDMAEWPEDLRVRQFPEVANG